MSVVFIIFPYLTGFGLFGRARLPLPGGARDVAICAVRRILPLLFGDGAGKGGKEKKGIFINSPEQSMGCT
ncbi:hypothetical protein M703_01790 [Neisseria gonorrhoeae SK29344]|nr:hypothetical protein T556_11940 [Neisseria gonorrhoeae NG-k51.05]KLR92442.1 hypothetical protein M685_03945 [Neisseria gonorrhoeae SK16259]KLS08628.1 hypothetical protein M703_01790 [Neisseria gonorrhoeae SK29344]KLS11184.1 hypothetical protein M716_10155 [Neisseria gonorrhoeae SK32402]KLS26806.1 hypothetical protein M733_01820 [Neisseria gonorrhoeae ATL_2011_05-13]KLS57342.1 hypothetical protein M742_07355 [Neisseria gonorrhoeae NYC_2011_05_07]KLS78191.1 hypothetical protein M771_09545 [N